MAQRLNIAQKLQLAWLGSALVASSQEVLENAPDPDWFSTTVNGVPLSDVAKAVLSIAHSGGVVTAVELIREIRQLGKDWSKNFGPEFIRIASEAHDEMGGIVGEYTSLIHERWLAEQVAELAKKASDAALVGEDYRQYVLRMHDVVTSDSSEGAASAADAFREHLDSWKGATKIRVRFDLPDLDELLFITEGTLTTLGARTSHGKTALAIQMALATARAGIPVVYYSSEMTRGEIAARMAAQIGGVSLTELVRGHGALRDGIKMSGILEELGRLPIDVIQTNRINEVVVDMTRRFASKRSRVAFVDFVQDFRGPGGEDYIVISNFLRDLKGTAQRFDGIVIGAAQINRGTEMGGKSRPPRKSDLKGSGTFEETSDNVVLLYRHLNDDGVLGFTGEIIVDKQRNGQVGYVNVEFDPHSALFKSPYS